MRPAPTRPPEPYRQAFAPGPLSMIASAFVLAWHPCGHDRWLGLPGGGRSPKAARGGGLRAGWSSMNGRRPRTQCARLVVHADRDAADLLFVLTRVMGAEQQFTAARQLDA